MDPTLVGIVVGIIGFVATTFAYYAGSKQLRTLEQKLTDYLLFIRASNTEPEVSHESSHSEFRAELTKKDWVQIGLVYDFTNKLNLAKNNISSMMISNSAKAKDFKEHALYFIKGVIEYYDHLPWTEGRELAMEIESDIQRLSTPATIGSANSVLSKFRTLISKTNQAISDNL